jgi:hypothetical protein
MPTPSFRGLAVWQWQYWQAPGGQTMNAPKRVKITGDLYHPQIPTGAVRVTRPTRWGNPYPVKAYGRHTAIVLYRTRLAMDSELAAAARRELAGKDLACWCPLDKPCHADVLLEVANP